ncbi:MAG: L,D-transpeptidase family protein [Parvibaculum sp.]|nr:L,D-transpeptidase family protein [Parvibaculum sp.]
MAPEHILVTGPKGATVGRLRFGVIDVPCALGRSGIVTDKREGDGGTPTGTFPLRELRYRADRLAPPASPLETRVINANDGWCDAPADKNYNRFVTLPYPVSHEKLMRDDGLYDIVIMLGYNDDPVVSGKGSAIFFHLAKEKAIDGKSTLQPTEGCVALTLANMRTVLALITASTQMEIALGD